MLERLGDQTRRSEKRLWARSARDIVSPDPTMTTFTKLPEGEKPFVEVDAGKKLSRVNPLVYGGFTEYVPGLPPRCPVK